MEYPDNAYLLHYVADIAPKKDELISSIETFKTYKVVEVDHIIGIDPGTPNKVLKSIIVTVKIQ